MIKAKLEPWVGEILAIDPAGGGSTCGLFLFKNWNDFTISHYKPKEGENWLKQVRNIEKTIQNNKLTIIAVETGKLINKFRYSHEMPELIKVVGGTEDLADRYKIEYREISNTITSRAKKTAELGLIPGLKKVKELNENRRWSVFWKFKGQKINEHEKDAILVFYILWKRLKREWPWTD